MKQNIHIYQIYFPTSNECYIGLTRNLKRRMFEHLENESLVGKALRKYDDWQISILHTCKTRDEANRIEIEEIRNFNSVAPNGYNLTRGGDGQNPEIIAKIGRANKGRKHSKEVNKSKGRKHTEERKQEQSRKMTGRKRPGWKVCEEGRKNMAEVKIGNQNAKGHNWVLSPVKIKQRTIKQLRNKIAKLEAGIN